MCNYHARAPRFLPPPPSKSKGCPEKLHLNDTNHKKKICDDFSPKVFLKATLYIKIGLLQWTGALTEVQNRKFHKKMKMKKNVILFTSRSTQSFIFQIFWTLLSMLHPTIGVPFLCIMSLQSTTELCRHKIQKEQSSQCMVSKIS